MEPRQTPEYTLEVFADPASAKDVIKGIPLKHYPYNYPLLISITFPHFRTVTPLTTP